MSDNDDYVQVDENEHENEETEENEHENENGNDSGSENKDELIKELRDRISELESQNKSLQTELNQEKDKNSQLQFEFQKLKDSSRVGTGNDNNDNNDNNNKDSNDSEINNIDNFSVSEVRERLTKTQSFLDEIKLDRDILQYKLADMELADRKLRRRLSEQLGSIPDDAKDIGSVVQYMLAEEQYKHLQDLKKAKEQKELELKQLEYQVADERYERMKTEKEKELAEKQAQYDVAEAKYEKIKLEKRVNKEDTESNGSYASDIPEELKNELDQVKYQLADEQMKAITLERKTSVLEHELNVERQKISHLNRRISQANVLQVNTLLKYAPSSNEQIGTPIPEPTTIEWNDTLPPAPPLPGVPAPNKIDQNDNNNNYNNDNNEDLGGVGADPSSFNKQKSQQQWTDSQGHTRDVSMPQMHKQFTLAFKDDIDDIRKHVDEEEVNEIKPKVDMYGDGGDDDFEQLQLELKEKNLEIEKLAKQLTQFTDAARDERALIWEKPRLTIQQISTFLRKLPDKHKEKMWERHAIGDYVRTEKVGSLLFSIVALCIKIHDRNVKTPPKGILLKKLEPYTRLIQTQINEKDDTTGMIQDDFNDNLHEWLLLPLPIENLLTASDKDNYEKRLADKEKEVIKAKKEVLKERRKSISLQQNLAALKAGGNDDDSDDEIDSEQIEAEANELRESTAEKEARIEELENDLISHQEQINDLKSKLTDSENQSQEVKHRDTQKLESEMLHSMQKENIDQATILDLKNEIRILQQKLEEAQQSAARESEDETDAYAGSQGLSRPIKLVNSHSNEWSDEKMEYSINDNKVTKSEIYLGWKRKAERIQKQLDDEHVRANEFESTARRRAQSIAVLEAKIKQYQTFAEEYQILQQTNTQWKTNVQKIGDQIQRFDISHESQTPRRESITDMHGDIQKQIITAEAEHEKIVSEYEKQIQKLNSDVNYVTNQYEVLQNQMTSSKVQLENDYNRLQQEMDDFRKSISQLQNDNAYLQNNVSKIQNEKDEIQNEKNALDVYIQQLTENKVANMESTAIAMQQLRDMIYRLNDRLKVYEKHNVK